MESVSSFAVMPDYCRVPTLQALYAVVSWTHLSLTIPPYIDGTVNVPMVKRDTSIPYYRRIMEVPTVRAYSIGLFVSYGPGV